MANIRIEKDGRFGNIDESKVAAAEAKGWKRAAPAPKPAADPAPAEEGPGFFRRAYDAADRLGKKAAEGAEDALTTFGKYGSLGLDDNLAGLAGAAGSLYGMARDEATGFGVNENPRAALATAYREGRDERRAATDAAAERSPVYSAQGALGGTGLQVLAAPASFAGQVATGVVGGVGASDADTPEDAVVPALVGGALGTAGKTVPALGRLLTRVKGAGSSLLRQAQPAATAAAEKVAGGLEAVGPMVDQNLLTKGLRAVAGVKSMGATEGALMAAPKMASVLRKMTAKPVAGGKAPELDEAQLAEMLQRLKGGADEAVTSPVPELGKEELAVMLAKLKGGAADDVVLPLTRKVQPVETADIIDEAPVARAADDVPAPLLRPAPEPAPAPDPVPESLLRPVATPEVITTPGPVAKSPSPGASQPGGIYMPPLQGMDAKIQEAAVRLGTTDLATIANDLKIPTTRIEGNLENLMRQFRFRDAVAKASPTPSQKLAEKAATEMDPGYGSVLRKAKETARSPIDNVSGRNIKQVAAVKQQETWRATYDNLNPDQRSLFLKQIKQETGLPDDTIRQRLKLTKAEWRRLSFDRSGGLSTPRRESVLRPKAEEPNASGGEGESEALTDMEQALLDRNARDAAEAAMPKSSFTAAREADEAALKGADAAKVADKELQKQIMEGNTPDWIKEAMAKEKLTDTDILPPRIQSYLGESRIAMEAELSRAVQGADEAAFVANTMDRQGIEDMYAILKQAKTDPAFDAQYWFRRTLKDNGFKDAKMLKDAANREAHEGSVAYERKWRKERGLPALEDFEGPVEVVGGARPATAAKSQDKTADELSAMMDKMLKKAKAKQAKQAKTAPPAPAPKTERLLRPIDNSKVDYQAAADRANAANRARGGAPREASDPRQLMNNAFTESGETAKILEYFEMPPLTGARAKAAEALGGAADDPIVIVRTPFHPAGSFSVGRLGKDGVIRNPTQRHTIESAQAFVTKLSEM